MVTFAAALSGSHVGADEPGLSLHATELFPLAADPRRGYAGRHYDLAEAGGFTTRDPIPPSTCRPGDLYNQYSYVLNRPTGYVDPLGEDWTDDFWDWWIELLYGPLPKRPPRPGPGLKIVPVPPPVPPLVELPKALSDEPEPPQKAECWPCKPRAGRIGVKLIPTPRATGTGQTPKVNMVEYWVMFQNPPPPKGDCRCYWVYAGQAWEDDDPGRDLILDALQTQLTLMEGETNWVVPWTKPEGGGVKGVDPEPK